LSGREAGRGHSDPANGSGEAEVAPGASRSHLEGSIPELATAEEIRAALESAFDYRGDVTITCKDGKQIEGYVFDRRSGNTLQNSFVRVLPKDGSSKRSVAYSDITALSFSGRDMAAGNNWENWVKHYWERKAAGESGISLEPEKLE
jgi:hypothetical protein